MLFLVSFNIELHFFFKIFSVVNRRWFLDERIIFINQKFSAEYFIDVINSFLYWLKFFVDMLFEFFSMVNNVKSNRQVNDESIFTDNMWKFSVFLNGIEELSSVTACLNRLIILTFLQQIK